MNKKRMLAVFLAAIMLAVAFGSIIQISDDASATNDTQSQGNVKVYYYNTEAQAWRDSTQTAYNLYLAVYGALDDLGYTMTTTAANTQWFKEEVGYSNPNINYGLIDEINGSGSFTIKGYNNTNSQWEDITNVPLGWLRPFADYSVVDVGGHYSVYANVAIYSGNQNCDAIQGMIQPVQVQGNDTYLCSFDLYDAAGSIVVPIGTQVKTMVGGVIQTVYLTSDMLLNGVTVYGYGSDAYLALKDAVGISLVGQTDAWINHGDYYTYYSWMDSLFGVGTSSETVDGETIYHYWASYDSNEAYLDWTFGYYSAVHFDSANVKTSFTIMYM